MRTLLAVAAAALLLSTGAYAQPFDLAAAGIFPVCCTGAPPIIPQVEFTGIGTTSYNPDVLTIGAGGHGRVLGVDGTASIFIIRPDLTRTRIFANGTNLGANTLVADRNGNMYVMTGGAAGRLLAIRPDGTLRYNIPFAGEGGDLAADQCTLVYAQTPTVLQRFDVCTGTPLTDPQVIAQPFSALRILPDGGLLVATRVSTLLRYDAGGTLVRTYTLPDGYFAEALALGEHGATALVGRPGDYAGLVLEINLATGAIVREVVLETSPNSLVAYRGWTAAIGALASSDIPSVSSWGLIALTLLLMATAVRRLL